MSNISQWSTTAGSNNSAAPNGAPEGMAPNAVNDVIRENMAAAAKVYLDQKGTATTGGTTTAYTLTTSNAHASLGDISLFSFQVNAANTGAATLAVDGLTAKAMQLNGAALAAGDLRADEIVIAVYNPDNDVFDIFKSGVNQGAIKTDTISEQTSGEGVTIDGVLLKDGGAYIGGSGAANYLDDYEEGTWTPIIEGTTTNPTQSYAVQRGVYVKVGNLIYAEFYVSMAASGVSGGTGNAAVAGFPFSFPANGAHGQSGTINYSVGWGTSNGAPSGLYAFQGTDYALLRVTESTTTNPASNAVNTALAADVGNNTIVSGSICYRESD